MTKPRPTAETGLRLFKLKSYMVNDDPDCTENAEQILFIRRDGWIRFSNCNGRGNLTIDKKFKIEAEKAARILTFAEVFFNVPYRRNFAAGPVRWDLTLTGDSGIKFSFSGSSGIFPEELTRVSNMIRELLELPELLCFDGHARADRLDLIRIEYHKFTCIHPAEKTEDCIRKETSELLTIDRASDTIVYDRRIAEECTMSTKLHIQEGVAAFLDRLDAVGFLTEPVSAKPPILPADEERNCTITVISKYGGERTLKTCFDRRGLPCDWKDFANKLKDFLSFYGFGDLMDPSFYDSSLARGGDRRFAFVSFNNYGKAYSYLCEDPEIREDDWAVVPVGENNDLKIVHVERIEYCSEENAPYPIDKIKSILRKATEEELYALAETSEPEDE